MLALFLVPAFSRANYEVSLGEASQFTDPNLFIILPKVFKDVFYNLKVAFVLNFENYLMWLKIFSVIYLIFSVYVIGKVTNKKEYERIEHG